MLTESIEDWTLRLTQIETNLRRYDTEIPFEDIPGKWSISTNPGYFLNELRKTKNQINPDTTGHIGLQFSRSRWKTAMFSNARHTRTEGERHAELLTRRPVKEGCNPASEPPFKKNEDRNGQTTDHRLRSRLGGKRSNKHIHRGGGIFVCSSLMLPNPNEKYRFVSTLQQLTTKCKPCQYGIRTLHAVMTALQGKTWFMVHRARCGRRIFQPAPLSSGQGIHSLPHTDWCVYIERTSARHIRLSSKFSTHHKQIVRHLSMAICYRVDGRVACTQQYVPTAPRKGPQSGKKIRSRVQKIEAETMSTICQIHRLRLHILSRRHQIRSRRCPQHPLTIDSKTSTTIPRLHRRVLTPIYATFLCHPTGNCTTHGTYSSSGPPRACKQSTKSKPCSQPHRS